MAERKTCPKCFSLIGVRTRAKIIQQLKKKPDNVSAIARHFFPLTQPTVSHHLKALEKMGIIFSKKKGRENFYFLDKRYPCKKCFLFEIPFKI